MSDESAFDPDSSDATTTAPARRLQPGETLAGRFVIIRFIAQGGMGEVYEAADLHLQRKHHALKTIRPDIAERPLILERFEREVLLAREINHQNVCPTFDLFHDRDAGGPITFLTMKLLRGESLHAHLKRFGRLDSDEAISIARQMAAGLDAAHRKGVVHRDFKPGNVMIEQTVTGPHVSITDFGLSRALDAEQSIGAAGQVIGTAGYIAPEMLLGRPVDATADVYAFGVVVYEMLTGSKPESPAARQYLSPSACCPGLDPRWDEVVAGCLAADPQKRFQSAGEAIARVDPRERSTTAGSRVRPSWWRRLTHRSRAAAVSAMAALAVLAALVLLARGWDQMAHPLPNKRFVALMAWPADPATNHQALLKSALDAIGSRLSRAEAVTKNLMTISADDVTPQSPAASPGEAVRTLGANLVLAASVRDESGGITVDLALLGPSGPQPVRRRTIHVAAADLAQLPEAAVAAAATLLDVTLPQTPWRDQDELAALPGATFQMLAAADELARQPNGARLDEAIDQYQRVLEASPKFALAYAKLSMTYGLKYQRTSDRAVLNLAERNADSALRLNAESATAMLSRVLVDLAFGNTSAALDGVARAQQLDPGNPQVLVAKAKAYRTLDRRADEEAVYREIIHNRPNYWPAYDQLGLALYRQARYQEAAAIFSEGLAIAPRIVRLLNNLGAMQMLLHLRKEAGDTYRRSVDAAPTSTAYQNLGTLAFMDGDFRSALANYEKARDLNPKDEVTWRNIGDTYTMLGQRDRTIESYAKAAAVVSDSLKINPKRGEAWMTLALCEAKLGKRDEAERAMASAEQYGASTVPSQFKKAQALALLGRKDDALALLVDLLHQGLSTEDVELAVDLGDLRKDPRYQRAVLDTHRVG